MWLTKEISSFVRQNQKLPLVVGAVFSAPISVYILLNTSVSFIKLQKKGSPLIVFHLMNFYLFSAISKGNIIFLGNERKYFCSIKFYVGEVFILFIPIKICTSISFLYRGYIHPYIFIQPVNRLWGYANRKRMCFLFEHFFYTYIHGNFNVLEKRNIITLFHLMSNFRYFLDTFSVINCNV